MNQAPAPRPPPTCACASCGADLSTAARFTQRAASKQYHYLCPPCWHSQMVPAITSTTTQSRLATGFATNYGAPRGG